MSLFTPGAAPGPETESEDRESAGSEEAAELQSTDADAEQNDAKTDSAEADEKDDGGSAPRRWRSVVGWAVTVAAVALVLFGLLLPDQLVRLTPGAFARIPIEGVVGAGILLVLPGRARTVAAVAAGTFLGLLTIVKCLDMGFNEVLVRPFDPVLDWVMLRPAVEFVDGTSGRSAAVGVVIAVVLLVVAVLVLMALSVLRIARVAARYHRPAAGGLVVLAAAWAACTALGAQFVQGVPVASDGSATLTMAHAKQVGASIDDRKKFAAQAAVDPFRDTPGDKLLTGLRGKDVMLNFVESYGRDAVEDPEFAPQVDAVLDDGTRRLRAAGYSARSAWLTSPTAGGGSWLAHSTLLSGLWINNQQRYRTLVSSDRLTLNRAFQRAGWRSVGLVPGVSRAWPESRFFGFDKVYDSDHLGYRGSPFGWATMPDQYSLLTLHRTEFAKPDHPPLMVEMPMLSSHAPWAPIPHMIDWDAVGDGSVYKQMAASADQQGYVWKDKTRIRAQYRKSIEYTLTSLISYVEKYGDKNLVLIFLGDHQPAPVITGEKASRDVPITIVAHDKAVLDRVSGWNWQDGLRPGKQAPLWAMSDFRNRFLTAFSS
ncbi:sulfatase [Actinomadura fibrosa]|uniref:Sulfatase n=1 Tax=Actinomadura fibrosa TaxID=111802 RepID=A0ABW2XPS8_9ACTN|nr:sulfatase [Actinomadura fibrosa]